MNKLIQKKLSFGWMIASLFSLLLVCCKVELHSSQPKTIVLFSNWNDRACGVAEHSRIFKQTLVDKGINVVQLDSMTCFKDSSAVEKTVLQIAKTNPDVVNIQYHSGLHTHMDAKINRFMRIIKRDFNIPTAISCHSEGEGMEKRLNKAALFIYYCQPRFTVLRKGSKSVFIPLPAPRFESSLSQAEMRKKYGYDVDDIVISTCGFAIPHKRIPEIVNLLASHLQGNAKFKLQLLVSPHQTYTPTIAEIDKIREAIVCNDLEDQIYLSGKYLKINEYLERLSVSNLGFSWSPPDQFDASAIEKDFVSVRVPLVVNDVKHNQLMPGEGLIRVDGELEEFVSEIILLSLDLDRRKLLKKEMKRSYSKINYGYATDLHLKYFRKMVKH